MGFIHIQDRRVPAELCQYAKHFPVSSRRILYKGIKLSVGKCSCSALPELHIGGRVKLPCFPEPGYPVCPCVHVLPAFQEYGHVSLSGQHKAAEQPCRASADNDGTAGHKIGPRLRKPVGCFLADRHIPVLQPARQLFLLLESGLPDSYVHHIAVPYIRLFSGVHRLLDDGKLLYLSGRNAQHPGSLLQKSSPVVSQRHL